MTDKHQHLSRREREIMDIIYHRNQATALEVLEAMASPPSYSAIRALLNILERKGHLKHTKAGKKYVYLPTGSRRQASKTALKRVVETFFAGSIENAFASLLEINGKIPEQELTRMKSALDELRKKKR